MLHEDFVTFISLTLGTIAVLYMLWQFVCAHVYLVKSFVLLFIAVSCDSIFRACPAGPPITMLALKQAVGAERPNFIALARRMHKEECRAEEAYEAENKRKAAEERKADDERRIKTDGKAGDEHRAKTDGKADGECQALAEHKADNEHKAVVAAEIANLKEELQAAQNDKARAKREAAADIARLKEELQAARDNKAHADREASNIAEANKELKTALDRATARLTEHERSLDTELTIARAQIDSLKTERSNACTRVTALEMELTTARTQNASLEAERNKATARISELEESHTTERKDACNRISNLEDERNNAGARISNLEMELTTARTQNASLEAERNRAAARISELEESYTAERNNASTRIADLENGWNNANTRIANLEMELINARNAVDLQTASQMNELANTNNGLTVQNAELRTELESAYRNVREREETCASMGARIDEEVGKVQQLKNALEGACDARIAREKAFIELQERANKAEARVKELREMLRVSRRREINFENESKKEAASAQKLAAQVQKFQEQEHARNESIDAANSYLDSLIQAQGGGYAVMQTDTHSTADGTASNPVPSLLTSFNSSAMPSQPNMVISDEDFQQVLRMFLKDNPDFSLDLPTGASGSVDGTVPNLGLTLQANSDGTVPVYPGTGNDSGQASTEFNALSNTLYGVTTTLQPGAEDFTGGLVQSVEPLRLVNPGMEMAPQLDTSLQASGSAQSVEPLRLVNLDMEMAPQPSVDGRDS